LKEKDPERFKLYRMNMMKIFNFLLLSLDIDKELIEKPMNTAIFDNPYSPEVQLIMILYSMEPPFYADVNYACWTLDNTKLQSLGPFARAISKVLLYRSDAKRVDAIERGL